MDDIINAGFRCPKCGDTSNVAMTRAQYYKFLRRDDNIQSIFPHLSPDDREILISGLCHECQRKIFKY